MARVKRSFSSQNEFTLATTAGWKTLIILEAPANIALAVDRLQFKPRGIVNTDKHVNVRLIEVSDLGTGGQDRSSQIGCKQVGRSEAAQAKIWEAPFSVEPTVAGNEIWSMAFHPQQPEDLPVLEEGEIELYGGKYLALQYENENGTAVPARPGIHWEE